MSRTILYAEDEAAIRDLVAEGLVSAGYTVDTAADGVEAIERLAEKTFDLLLLDIKMPRKTGLDVLAHLKEKGMKPRVIMLSAVDELTIAIKAVKLGANDYLTKPFNFDDLLKAIEKVLKRTD